MTIKNPIEEITADEDAVTIDRVMSKAPSAVSDADLTALVEAMRRDRIRFIAAEAKKQERAEGLDVESSDE